MSGALSLPPWALAVAFVVTAISALVQGTIGFGSAVIAVPVLALVHPALAPVPQLLLGLPLSLATAWRERHAARPREVGWILAGRIPGLGIGLVLLAMASARVLDASIAIMVLAAVTLIGSGIKVRRTPVSQLVAGTASGAFGLVSSIGGPPVALLYRDETGPTIRANLALVFSVGVSISIVGRVIAHAITTRDVALTALLLPALFGGFWASRFLTGHVEGRPMRIAVLVISGLAAAALLARSLA